MLLDNRFINHEVALNSLYRKLNMAKQHVGLFEDSEKEVYYKPLHNISFCLIYPNECGLSRMWPVREVDVVTWEPQFKAILDRVSKAAIKGKHLVMRPQYGQEDGITICTHCTGKADALELNMHFFITSIGVFDLFEMLAAYAQLLQGLADKYELTVGQMHCTVIELTLIEHDWYLFE